MSRIVLIPLHVVVPDGDDREPQELADVIVATLALDPDVIGCDISAGIAEEAVAPPARESELLLVEARSGKAHIVDPADQSLTLCKRPSADFAPAPWHGDQGDGVRTRTLADQRRNVGNLAGVCRTCRANGGIR